MSEELPPELATLRPFLLRGNELKQHDPVIAYYCFYFFVQQALSLKDRSREATAVLFKLMDELEKMKAGPLAGSEYVASERVGLSYCENFALKIFLRADSEDRAGQATKKTAMSFLAASVFLQVLQVFNHDGLISADTVDDIEEKVRYAKWKAADIAKALRDGRKPDSGPPGSVTEIETPPSIPASTQPPNSSAAPLAPVSPVKHKGPVLPVAPISSHTPLFDPAALDKAQKFAKFAISAMQYEDLKSAVENLEKSLAIVRPMFEASTHQK